MSNFQFQNEEPVNEDESVMHSNMEELSQFQYVKQDQQEQKEKEREKQQIQQQQKEQQIKLQQLYYQKQQQEQQQKQMKQSMLSETKLNHNSSTMSFGLNLNNSLIHQDSNNMNHSQNNLQLKPQFSFNNQEESSHFQDQNQQSNYDQFTDSFQQNINNQSQMSFSFGGNNKSSQKLNNSNELIQQQQQQQEQEQQQQQQKDQIIQPEQQQYFEDAEEVEENDIPQDDDLQPYEDQQEDGVDNFNDNLQQQNNQFQNQSSHLEDSNLDQYNQHQNSFTNSGQIQNNNNNNNDSEMLLYQDQLLQNNIQNSSEQSSRIEKMKDQSNYKLFDSNIIGFQEPQLRKKGGQQNIPASNNNNSSFQSNNNNQNGNNQTEKVQFSMFNNRALEISDQAQQQPILDDEEYGFGNARQERVDFRGNQTSVRGSESQAFKKRRNTTGGQRNNTYTDTGIKKNQNQPSFFAKRIKNFLSSDKSQIFNEYKAKVEGKGHRYEDFQTWLDDPKQNLKEIWNFEEVYSLRQRETPQIKQFKMILKEASFDIYRNYMINQIVRSGETEHQATKQNSSIKKEALIKTIGAFAGGVNDPKKLNGIFAEKKKSSNNKQNLKKSNKQLYKQEIQQLQNESNLQQVLLEKNNQSVGNFQFSYIQQNNKKDEVQEIGKIEGDGDDNFMLENNQNWIKNENNVKTGDNKSIEYNQEQEDEEAKENEFENNNYLNSYDNFF